MDFVEGFWQQIVVVWNAGVFGVSLGPLLLGLLIVIVGYLARGPIAFLVLILFRKLAARTKGTWDNTILDVIEKPLRFLILVIAFYFAIHVSVDDVSVVEWFDRLVRSLIAFTIFWTLYRAVEPFTLMLNVALIKLGPSPEARETLRGFIIKLLKVVIVLLGIAAVLQEWGFNVAAVLGGLGLVGMAVAFGAQDMIANLFSGMMIFLNRIFEKGNWIKTPSVEGVVEDIGLFVTRIRQFDMALVTIENKQLTDGPITNYTRMTHRRIFWKIGVEYRTTEAQLREITDGVRDYIDGNDAFQTDPDSVPFLVFVDSFNDSSIDILVYCFTKTTTWAQWMAHKQDLAFKIKEIVEGAGTGFAFPSSSIYLEKWPLGKPEPFPVELSRGDVELEGEAEEGGAGGEEGAPSRGN